MKQKEIENYEKDIKRLKNKKESLKKEKEKLDEAKSAVTAIKAKHKEKGIEIKPEELKIDMMSYGQKD